jgi:hypothetical protein
LLPEKPDFRIFLSLVLIALACLSLFTHFLRMRYSKACRSSKRWEEYRLKGSGTVTCLLSCEHSEL